MKMADLSQPNHPSYNPDDHLARLLAPSTDEPWYKSFIQNVKEALNPPKLPPLEVTSKPVAVKDIWGLYGRKKESGLMSLAVHSFVVVMLFTVLSNKAVQTKMKEAAHLMIPLDLAPFVPDVAPKPKVMQGG